MKKNEILKKAFDTLGKNQELRGRLKIFAFVGLIGVVLLGAMTLWAGWAGFKYVSHLASSATGTESIETFKSKVETMPVFEASQCLNQAQRLLNIDTLLNSSILEELELLKNGCFRFDNPKAQDVAESELI